MHPLGKTFSYHYLYDLKNDPCEKNNLVNNEEYAEIIGQMRALLSREMVNAGEEKPAFHKPITVKQY